MRLAERRSVGAFVVLASLPWAARAAAAEPGQLPPPSAGAAEIGDAAREILARPEFREPPKSLYQRLLDALSEGLARLIRTLVGGSRGSVVAVAVTALALVALVWLVVRGVRSGRRRSSSSDDASTEVQRRRSPVDWDAEVATLEEKGDWRGGLRCRYRALVARLAGRGLLEEVPGRTAGEYRSAVGVTAPAALPSFAEATDLFERAWYGNEATGPEAASSFGELADEVLAGASR